MTNYNRRDPFAPGAFDNPDVTSGGTSGGNSDVRLVHVPDPKTGLIQEFEVKTIRDAFGNPGGEQDTFVRWLVPTAGGGTRPATTAEISQFVQGIDPESATSGGGGGGGYSISDIGPVSAGLRTSELEEAKRAAQEGEAIEKARLEQDRQAFNATQSTELERMRIETDQFNSNHELNIRSLNEQARQADNDFALQSTNLSILQEKLRIETEQGNRQIALQTQTLIEQTRARVEQNRIERESLTNEISIANANFRLQASSINAQNDIRRQELGEERRQFNIGAKQSLAETLGRLQSRPGDLGELAGFLTSLESTLPGSINDDTNFVTDRSLAPLEIARAAAASIDNGDPFTVQNVGAEQAANAATGTVPDADAGAITSAVGGEVASQNVGNPTLTGSVYIDPSTGEVMGPGDIPGIAANVAVGPNGTQVDIDGDGTPDVATGAGTPGAGADGALEPKHGPSTPFVFPDGSTKPGVTTGVGPDGEPTSNYYPNSAPNSPPLQGDPNFGTFDLDQEQVFAPGGDASYARGPSNPYGIDVTGAAPGNNGGGPVDPDTQALFDAFNYMMKQQTTEQTAQDLTDQSFARPISYGDGNGGSISLTGTTPHRTDPSLPDFQGDEFGFADGGVGFFSTPTTINVGENGPEAVQVTPVGGAPNQPTKSPAAGVAPSGTSQQGADFFNRASELALELSGLGRDFNPLDVAGPGTDQLLVDRAAALASARRGIDPEFFKRRVGLLKPQGVREGAVGRSR